MSYQHQYVDGTKIHFPIGKVVCIGRNYAEHAKELDNPIPTEPLLFIKPGSCVVALEGGFAIPAERGSVHYEAEISVLIGKPLSNKPSVEEVLDAISGFAPGLDLTLRAAGRGSLDEVIELTGLFIGKGPVVQRREADGKIDVEKNTRTDAMWTGPLAVLINQGSASASEALTSTS